MNNQKTFKGLRLAALGLVAVAAFTAGCSDVSTELKTPVYKRGLP